MRMPIPNAIYKGFFKINEIFKDFVQINCIINFSTNKMATSKNKKRAMHCGWQCSFKLYNLSLLYNK